MIAETAFWQRKTLSEMSDVEWESLCDGCGKCCLHKLEDEDTGDVYYTDIACKLLDINTCRCQRYQERKSLVESCLQLSLDNTEAFYWLPSSCAYRLIIEGKPLYPWHPLISGTPETVHQAGISVRQKVIAEESVAEDDYEERIVYWVE